MYNNKQKAIIYTSKERSFYVGKLETIFQKKNASSLLLVSTGKALELLNENNQTVCCSKSLLLPAGVNVRINTHNAIVAMFFLDYLGHDVNQLANYMHPGYLPSSHTPFYSDFQLQSDIIEYAEYLSEQRPPSQEAFEILHNWVNALNPGVKSLADPRIAKVVAMIKQSYSENIPVAHYAAQVNLSTPRLIKLFNQVTGTSIRRFRNWNRIIVTAHKLSEGWSLTEAALHAGFNDYAHFSNSYRELAGASPSAAHKNTEIRVFHAA